MNSAGKILFAALKGACSLMRSDVYKNLRYEINGSESRDSQEWAGYEKSSYKKPVSYPGINNSSYTSYMTVQTKQKRLEDAL